MRRNPSVIPNLPPGAQSPRLTSPQLPQFPYTFQITPPGSSSSRDQHDLHNPWDNHDHPQQAPVLPPRPPSNSYFSSRQRAQSAVNLNEYGARSSPSTSGDDWTPRTAAPRFPEAQVSRTASYGGATPLANRGLSHHHSKSDLGVAHSELNHTLRANPSVASFASSYNAHNNDGYASGSNEGYENDTTDEHIVKGMSELLLQSEDGLRLFQSGELPENDQEWYRLVPPEAREALGHQEVQRQSVLFEVIKSEREYVADLEAVEDVFVTGLRNANPPIIPAATLNAFIYEVFGNLREILAHHQRILAALFARQREQHPLIQSVADIILDTTLKADFRSAYETYIKHYPLAESHHRKQLKRNQSYEIFIQSISSDPRIRKRDLITFLSRPVTKLPRLNLLLEQILKLTDVEYEHPDLETLPIILGILRDCIKSTQPGIEAAESKVKFWALCESLVFQKGEIIDMDLYNESRSLVYTGPVIRRLKTETGFSEKWTDVVAALLDNYFILTREEKRPNGSIKRLLMSRPLPLSFLRLGSFDSPPETRREKADDGRLLESFRYQNVPIYPFTIYHAANKATRRYTLYATSEVVRKKWHSALIDAIGVHRVRQEANMWFSPQVVTDGFFKVPKVPAPMVSKVTGRILCAVPFVNGSKRFLAVGCAPGIYVAPANSEEYRWALNSRSPTALMALTTLGNKTFNRLVVHTDQTLLAYSLDILARIASGHTNRQTLDASIERVCGRDANVFLCKHLHLGGRALLVYASKRRLGSSMNLQVLEAVDSSEQAMTPQRAAPSSARSFRTYGETGYVPKDAYDIVGLAKTIGICTSGGIVTADPSNLAQSNVALVPDFQDAISNSPMASLKSHIEGLKPLGFVRVDPNELLVIYDEIGCYINKHGVPTRKCGYIKWETKAASYATRNGHILLMSPEFIEVRNITTGRIVQVIEGTDIRLLYCRPYIGKDDPVLVAMKGTKEDSDGTSEKIVELLETEEITAATPTGAVPTLWDEWDM